MTAPRSREPRSRIDRRFALLDSRSRPMRRSRPARPRGSPTKAATPARCLRRATRPATAGEGWSKRPISNAGKSLDAPLRRHANRQLRQSRWRARPRRRPRRGIDSTCRRWRTSQHGALGEAIALPRRETSRLPPARGESARSWDAIQGTWPSLTGGAGAADLVSPPPDRIAQGFIQCEVRPPARFVAQTMHVGQQNRGFPRRRGPRAQPQEFRSSDLPADALDEFG